MAKKRHENGVATSRKRVIVPRQPSILSVCFAACLHSGGQVSYFSIFPYQRSVYTVLSHVSGTSYNTATIVGISALEHIRLARRVFSDVR